MGRFLDLRTSENSNIFGAPNVGLSTPTVVGVIGLQTGGVSGPVVALNGHMTFSTIAGATVTTNILRNGVTIFTQVDFLPILDPAVGIDVKAADLLAPAAAETVYQMVASATPLIGGVTRVGPEVFWGVAQNGSVPTP